MPFSDKLTTLLQLAGVTNSRLAKALSVDPSLISRWRSGVRDPLTHPDLVLKMAQLFVQQLQTDYHRGQLAFEMGDERLETASADELTEAIVRWLYEDADERGEARTEISADTSGMLPGGHMSYTGASGRRAVLKRVFDLHDSRIPNVTVRFYSGESAVWLSDDIRYRTRLLRQNPALFDNVRKVKLILHSNATTQEMVSTIKYVIPFLKNGTLEIVQTPRSRQELLTGTILITGRHCAATSHGLVHGKSSIANLFTSKPFVRSLSEDFDALFAAGESIHGTHENVSLWDVFAEVDELLLYDDPLTFVGNSPSGIMLPPDMLQQWVRTTVGTPQERLRKQSMIEEFFAMHERFLARNKFYLLMPLYTARDIRGRAAAMLSLPRFLGKQTRITAPQYLDMLRFLRRRCDEHPNLVVGFVPELDHEFALMLQPRSACYLVKTTGRSVSYKSWLAHYLQAFEEFVAEKYGSPAELEARRAASIEQLDRHIAAFVQDEAAYAAQR